MALIVHLSISSMATKMRKSALLSWNLLLTLLCLAERRWSPCGATQIQLEQKLSKSAAFASVFPASLYGSSLESAFVRIATPPDRFNLAGGSRNRATLGKASRRLVPETTNREVQVLMDFKAGISSDPLGVLRSWSANDSDACSWEGVKCSPNSSHVVAIELGDLQLEGMISALLGQLPLLKQLDLSNNNFSGSIPNSLVNCSNLAFLNVSFNQMSGDIPAQMGELRNLLTLDLSHNNLTGDIPATLGNCSLLQYLDLDTNSIGGVIPSQLGLLSSLQTLNLMSGSLSGSVPSALGNCTSLVNLRLGVNANLGGELPLQLGELIKLQLFYVHSCNFLGSFPKWILNMTSMQFLDLSENQFYGAIPEDIGYYLPNLSHLYLRTNEFSGEIPRSIVNSTALVYLYLCENQLTGPIPPDIGLLRSMQQFYVFTNFLSGILPPSLANCSQLQYMMVGYNPFDPQVFPSWIGSFVNLSNLYLAHTNLYGTIPVEVGQLSALVNFMVWGNNLSGTVPASIGNCTSVTNFDVSANQLSGELPPELGLLPLIYFQVSLNFFSPGPIPPFLFNLTNVTILGIGGNPYNGSLDSYDFGIFGQLQDLELFSNDFEGSIPHSFANCSYLQSLDLHGNRLSGGIPPWLANLTDLGVVLLNNNQLSGTIPGDFTRGSQITHLDFSANKFDGAIPGDIGSTFSLQYLSLAANNLTGEIPSSLGNCTQLITLDLSQNRLTGSIPGSSLAMMATSLTSLNLSQNLLSGAWPSQLSQLINVQDINVSSNNLSGSIPPGVGSCVALQSLDLSFNQFTGPLPQDLGSLKHLISFNASYNNFEGPLPDSGAFKSNLTTSSFLGNPGLCGGILGPQRQCPVGHAPSSPMGLRHCKGFKCPSVWISVVAIAGAIVILCSVATVVAYYYSARHGSRPRKLKETFNIYRPINFSKTDILATIAAGEDNIIGKGANSTVYKAVLHDGETVALKTWRGLGLPGVSAGELATQDEKRWEMEISSEAHTLAKLRHRNIVKVFGFFSLSDIKAILLEYMPNGSLYAKLHENGPCTLTWAERFKIILGVTQGILYLHHEFSDPIIHRDLKSSNILLDAEMEAKVCDFGISKIAAGEIGEATASAVCGTFGYLPPEYGTGSRLSTKGDVYSFGVVLLELLTAKKASDVYDQNDNLVSIVEHCLQSSESLAFDLLDPTLKCEGINDANSRQQMMSTMRVGLLCTRALPQSRPSMNAVREMMLQIEDVGKETARQMTLDDLLKDDFASTSESPDSNLYGSS